jgi:hypothetical protein
LHFRLHFSFPVPINSLAVRVDNYMISANKVFYFVLKWFIISCVYSCTWRELSSMTCSLIGFCFCWCLFVLLLLLVVVVSQWLVMHWNAFVCLVLLLALIYWPSIHYHVFIHLFIRLFIHSFVNSFVYSLINSFIHSFIHSSIHSVPYDTSIIRTTI